MMVRTTIELAENLLQEAFSLMPNLRKREVFEIALTEFVQKRKQRDLRDLRGKIFLEEDYDYKSMRQDKDRGDDISF